MAKLSLKVAVAGRTYPISVAEHEERIVLEAAKNINKAIKLLKDNYAVKDMQDLLAMAALQLATKKDKNTSSDQKEFNLDIDDIESKLKSISEDLDKLN
ncbi:MAG: cell division protein ZapA [Crocinitomicaceae bacterium]|nr:cell division protein ZapA [Crocinitomicaceae bacterium]|tara:strand:+ start:32802 stop:33098 length:297 start_codon:yes stop_codon:yes gene_type:complete